MHAYGLQRCFYMRVALPKCMKMKSMMQYDFILRRPIT